MWFAALMPQLQIRAKGTMRYLKPIISILSIVWLLLISAYPLPLQAQSPNDRPAALTAEELYQRGHDTLSANYKDLALDEFKKSCAMAHAKSCFNVGILSETLYPGIAERSEEVDALAGYYAKSCSLGFQRGCVALAQFYRSDRYGLQDLPRAIKLFSDACDANEITGCEDLAEIHYRGEGINPDFDRAAQLFKRGCDADGRALSCFNYGLMREKGRGVPRDGAIALEYYRLGCRKGSDPSCINLAFDYVSREETYMAKGLFRQSCLRGAVEACVNLGELLRQTEVGHPDNVEAVGLFRKACEEGHGKSCRSLGQMAQDGVKAVGPKTAGIGYFKKGCELRFAPSCYNAGLSHWIGFHAPESRRWALFWFAKGCALKSATSCAGASLATQSPKKKRDRPLIDVAARRWFEEGYAIDPQDGVVQALKDWYDHGTKLLQASEADRLNNDNPVWVHHIVRSGTMAEFDRVFRDAKSLNLREAETGNTPIMTAILFDARQKLRKLLRAGASLELTDNGGNTALHHAARLEQPWNVLELLKAGAPANARNDEGHSFQHYFCYPIPAYFRTQEWSRSRAAVRKWLAINEIPSECK